MLPSQLLCPYVSGSSLRFGPLALLCVCVFITLRISTHSGHVILGIICHSNCYSEGRIDGSYFENL